MKTRRRWPGACLAGLGFALATLSGCQTWVAGMTLPSGHYLEHPPQYIPPSPPFPLPRELAGQEAAAAAAIPVPGGAELPPPLPAPVTLIRSGEPPPLETFLKGLTPPAPGDTVWRG